MTSRSLFQRGGVLIGLIALSVYLFYIGKGHALLIDTNAVTIDGKELRAPEEIEVSIDGQPATINAALALAALPADTSEPMQKGKRNNRHRTSAVPEAEHADAA